MGRPRGGPREEGAVLVAVVLLMLASFGLGQAIFLAARFELLAARAGARQLAMRVAAQGAVELALARGGGPWMDSVPNWGTGDSATVQIGEAQTTTFLRRLSAESWLIEATARRDGGPTAMSARLAWVLDPVERVAALLGVVGVGEGGVVPVDGLVDGDRIRTVEAPLTEDLCAPWSAAVLERFPSGSLPALQLLPDGVARPGLGELEFDTLVGLAEASIDGGGTPAPAERFGECVAEEPWNWGDPDRPYRPCGAYLPVRQAFGDLLVEGGVGQGILLVDGDLTLAAGTRYYGLILTTGTLHVRDRAQLTGYAVAVGGATVEPNARIVGSACWAIRVLSGNRARLGMAFAREEPVGPL